MLQEMKNNPKKIRFNRICTIAGVFGFSERKGKGSHIIFYRDDIGALLNFQNVKGKAKPYQVKQFIKVVEQYGLAEEGKDDAE